MRAALSPNGPRNTARVSPPVSTRIKPWSTVSFRPAGLAGGQGEGWLTPRYLKEPLLRSLSEMPSGIKRSAQWLKPHCRQRSQQTRTDTLDTKASAAGVSPKVNLKSDPDSGTITLDSDTATRASERNVNDHVNSRQAPADHDPVCPIAKKWEVEGVPDGRRKTHPHRSVRFPLRAKRLGLRIGQDRFARLQVFGRLCLL